jgi:hypothetical protein
MWGIDKAILSKYLLHASESIRSQDRHGLLQHLFAIMDKSHAIRVLIRNVDIDKFIDILREITRDKATNSG